MQSLKVVFVILTSLGHHATPLPTGVSEQIKIRDPYDKVGLIIGRGGDSIKNMQATHSVDTTTTCIR